MLTITHDSLGHRYPLPGHGTWLPALPATDIWWSSLETWDLPPCYWHLVAITGDLFKHDHLIPPTTTDMYWWPVKHVLLESGWYASYWNAFLCVVGMCLRGWSSWVVKRPLRASPCCCWLSGMDSTLGTSCASSSNSSSSTSNVPWVFKTLFTLSDCESETFHWCLPSVSVNATFYFWRKWYGNSNHLHWVKGNAKPKITLGFIKPINFLHIWISRGPVRKQSRFRVRFPVTTTFHRNRDARNECRILAKSSHLTSLMPMPIHTSDVTSRGKIWRHFETGNCKQKLYISSYLLFTVRVAGR